MAGSLAEKLDALVAEVKELPEERIADAVSMLELFVGREHGEALLTDEQIAEAEALLDDPGPLISAEDLRRHLAGKYGT